MTGQKKLADRFGMDYSYQLSPRAKIFRRDAGRITDMKDMKKLMRSNGVYRPVCIFILNQKQFR